MSDIVEKILRREMVADDENRQVDAETFEAIRNEIERLTRELADTKQLLQTAERERDEVVTALEPFADVARQDIGDDEADEEYFQPMKQHNRAERLRVGHLRTARTTLQQIKEGGE